MPTTSTTFNSPPQRGSGEGVSPTSTTFNSPPLRGSGEGVCSGEGVFISRHFTLAELTRSFTAQQRGLDNRPSPEALRHLQALVNRVLDPLRQLFGAPIYVNSGYRSPELNAAVGGAANSQHTLGEAADIRGATTGETRRLLGLALAHAADLGFDQLIAEECDARGFPKWLHISYGDRHRNQLIFTKR